MSGCLGNLGFYAICIALIFAVAWYEVEKVRRGK